MHTKFWWSNSDTTCEGIEIKYLFTSLGTSQILCEPTNFSLIKTPHVLTLS